MKFRFRTSRCVAVLLALAVFVMLVGYLLTMHGSVFETPFLVASCPDASLPPTQLYIESKDLPQSINAKIVMMMKEDSKFAIFDFNSYMYSAGITIRGNGYKVYFFKNFTVYEGFGLGQYSSRARELHQLYYAEVFEYIRKHGKPRDR